MSKTSLWVHSDFASDTPEETLPGQVLQRALASERSESKIDHRRRVAGKELLKRRHVTLLEA
jgi:hypothetical protein